MSLFKNRIDAGRQLTKKLLDYKNRADLLILALPRGGVPVAFEIASTLKAPMTVFLVRKLGMPGQEEFAMGAISEDQLHILDREIIQKFNISDEDILSILRKEQQELNRRLQYYRQGEALPSLRDHTVILVDDGVATGSTFKVAVQALKRLHPKKIVAAIPVASKSSLQEISLLVDEVACVASSEPFYSVGQWYENFEQTSDREVLNLLRASVKKFNYEETKTV